MTLKSETVGSVNNVKLKWCAFQNTEHMPGRSCVYQKYTASYFTVMHAREFCSAAKKVGSLFIKTFYVIYYCELESQLDIGSAIVVESEVTDGQSFLKTL